ncbi:hypothetical protein [Vulcanococcus sp. Clear-D1]|uniref:hypothetical protein n=1 Tax=Vulcanococcus sp. Clear-D1 TaxID=2766970 RepID=UPI00199BDF93|nr:hypothetical protein [Vulcanococcus sp. Clear-D1]MBD1194453.1 hypothetical protein [Vulcanococcus sp. Clear-D1]
MPAYTFDLSLADGGGIPIRFDLEALPESYCFALDGRSDNGEDDYECHRLRPDDIDISGLKVVKSEEGLILVTGTATIEDKDRSASDGFFSGCSNSGEVQISVCIIGDDGREVTPWSQHYTLTCKEEARVNGWALDSHNPPSARLDREIKFVLMLNNELKPIDMGDRREILERLVISDWADYAWGNYHCEYDFGDQSHIYKSVEMNTPESLAQFAESIVCLAPDALFLADEKSKAFTQVSLDIKSIVSMLQNQREIDVRAITLEYDNGDGWDD